MVKGRRAGGDDGGRAAILADLRRIPGVGPSIAGDLWDMGFRSAGELRGRDPEELYERLREMKGGKLDRCMLYVFRCAVYFVSTPEPDPELCLWWNWKDRPGK